MSDTGSCTTTYTANAGALSASLGGHPPASGFYTCIIAYQSDGSGALTITSAAQLSGACLGMTLVAGSPAPTGGSLTLLDQVTSVDGLSGLGLAATNTGVTKAPGIALQEPNGGTSSMPRSMDGTFNLSGSGLGASKRGSIVLTMKA